MNEEAVIETLARVEQEQALLRQGDKSATGFNMHMWFSESAPDEFGNLCGTTACFAGHAAVTHGFEAWSTERCRNIETGGLWEYEAAGQSVLGLTDAEASTLFYLDNLTEVYRWIARRMGVEEQVLRDKVSGYVTTEPS